MVSLATIQEKLQIAYAYYVELLNEDIASLQEGGCENNLSKLNCLNGLIRALEWDVADEVNDDDTTALYELLLNIISNYNGDTLSIDPEVVIPDITIIVQASGITAEEAQELIDENLEGYASNNALRNSQSTIIHVETNLYNVTKTIDDTTTDSKRDGAALVQLGRYLFILGGWNPYEIPATNNEVYRFNNSITSTTKLSNASWSPRHTFGYAVIDDSVFVYGGDLVSGEYQTDSWRGDLTGDNISWSLLNATCQWGDRILFGSTAHNNELYLIGGQVSLNFADGVFNDVWKSSNGIDWIKIADNLPQFGKNLNGTTVSYDGYIYVVCGGRYDTPTINGTFENDIWRSIDGVTWEQMPAPPFAGRQYPNVAVFDGKIWLVGGNAGGDTPTDNTGEIWYMNSFGEWTLLQKEVNPTHASGFSPYNSRLVVSTGNFWNDTYAIDKFRSETDPTPDSVVARDASGNIKANVVNVESGGSGGYTIGTTSENPNGDAVFYFAEGIARIGSVGSLYLYSGQTPSSLPVLILTETHGIRLGNVTTNGTIKTSNNNGTLIVSSDSLQDVMDVSGVTNKAIFITGVGIPILPTSKSAYMYLNAGKAYMGGYDYELNEPIDLILNTDGGYVSVPSPELPAHAVNKGYADATYAPISSVHYRGTYATLLALQTAIPVGNPGDEALVDAGVGEDALKYIWDDSDQDWVQGGGGSAASFATLTGSPSDNAALEERFDEKADRDSIDASAIALPELGTIISDDFNRASLGTNWTASGSGTFSIVSNQLQVSYGGSYATTNRIVYNAYGNSNLESFTLTSKVIAGTIDANSHGVGFGFEANSLYGLNSVRVNIRLNSANLGKIEYFSTGDGGSQTVSSPIGMTIVASDILTVTLKFIKNKFITTVYNATTNVTNSFELDISTGVGYTFGIPNSYRFSIIAAGGTHLIDDYQVYSNDVKNASLLCVGDSITKGLTTSHISNRFSELINNVTNTITVTNAGSGNKIEDINTSEVLSLEPQKILVKIGINNIQNGDNLATLQSKYTTLIDALVTGGYIVGTNLFVGTLLPHLTSDNTAIAAFNSWLFTNYGTSAVIDLYSSMLNTAGDAISGSYTIDGIHPNDEGHKVLANLIIVKLNLLSKPKKIGNLYPVVYDANGKVSIASAKYKGSVPKSRLQVIDESGKGVNISNSNADSGLFLGSIGEGNGYQLAGAAYESGSYIAKAPYVGGLLVHNGVTYFINKSGLTPGSSFGIDYSGTVTANKQWRLGSADTPHASALLDLNSTTNKGFLPPILTTTQRDAIGSPSEGLMIFNTTTKKLNFYNGTAWEAVTSAV